MKFKLNKIALALPLSIMAVGVVAQQNPDDMPNIQVQGATNKLTAKANKALTNNRYFVLLDDEPVALYQGGVKGFAATNIAASNGRNSTVNGKLNLTSSSSIAYSNYLTIKQNEVAEKINNRLKRHVELKQRYKLAVNGLLVELQPHEVPALRKLSGVLAVQKEELQQLVTDVGPQHVGAALVWDNSAIAGSKGEGLIVGIMDTGISSYKQLVYNYSTPDFSSASYHPSFADIGGDGYDHTNPNGEGVYFGDCVEQAQWCNDKVIGVISYEGATADISSWYDARIGTGQDDHGHGTHVSSTIAGNVVHDVQYPNVVPDMEKASNHQYYNSEIKVSMSGVAPHANIVSYKTCTTNGCWPSLAILSIEHAMANNIDVLNYSVGGGPESPWAATDSLAFLSAREAGIHTAVAAGNSGASGEKTVGSPGNSPWVTTVAALSHSRDFTADKTATFSGGASALENLVGKGATSGIGLDQPLEVVYAGDVENADSVETAGGIGYCADQSLPYYWSEESIQGKVVICRRGGVDADGMPLSRLSKGATALYAQAAAMIFINSEDAYDNVVDDMHVLPTIHLNKADGEKLLAWLSEGENHQVSFTDSTLVLNDEKADITASFTSRGPDYFTGDYLIPDVGAPGVNILAAGLGDDAMQSTQLAPAEQIRGTFRFMSGTSMASPHIAGMYVLMKAARPDWTPAEAQSALMTTAFTDVKEDDNFDGVMNRADFHRTGAGSARVNLAIEAGLVLNETRAGYEAANPLAEQLGIADDIAGWHGEPHQMNLPSLSKGSCVISCDWTRTFKATKSASWTVSFETFSEGFTLTADQSSFNLNAGEEIAIKFTAEASTGLAEKWVNARVILTPNDSAIPTQTLPATINFIAGTAPEIADVNAKRNNDSVLVAGITTIGTDDLRVSKTGIAKADVYEFDLMRDASNDNVFRWDDAESLTHKFIPLNVQADSKRLVIDVVETSSPDVDLYVGIDTNLDGIPDTYEMSLIVYNSTSPTSDELIDVINPRNDTYWLMVHNFSEGPAPLADHQMICEEGQQPDEGMECADAPIMDTVKISVTNVKYDDDTMTVTAPTSAAPLEEVQTKLAWDHAMVEGDIFHGVFWLGTSADLPENIGAVRVNMTRGEDDVKITEPVVQGDKISLAINVADNHSGQDRQYDFEMSLASGVVVDLIVKDTVVDGASMQMAADEFDYEISDDTVSWSHTQVNGANPVEFSIILDSSAVEGMTDATPVVSSAVNTSDEVDTVAPITPIFVEGRPQFSANASVNTVKEGKSVTLTASVVDAVVEEPVLSYQWRQVSGPAVNLSATGNTVTFDAPKVSSDQTISFELVGSNGSKSSLPETVAINVENSGSSGGSTGLLFMLMAGFGLLFRRKAK